MTWRDPFSEGLALVGTGPHLGYIDKSGKYAINPQFEGAGQFGDGRAPVFVNGRWGYIDKTGRMAINPQFDEGGNFSEGLAVVRLGDKYGYIDTSGKNGDHAAVQFSRGFSSGSGGGETDTTSYGYIDKSGRVKIAPQFDAAGDFSDGLALVAIADRYGYIDDAGKFAINPQFDQGGNFQAGIAPVWIGNREGLHRQGRQVRLESGRLKLRATTTTRESLCRCCRSASPRTLFQNPDRRSGA